MASLIVDWYGALATPPYKALVLIPQDYDNLTLLSGSAPNGVWELDTIAFWQDLKSLEETEEGIVFGDTQTHNLQYTIAGVTYADALAFQCEIAFYNPVASEDWTVILTGSNNDIFDVTGGVYVPEKGTGFVNLIPTNSAGLQLVQSVDGAAIDAKLALLLSAQDLTNEQKEAEHITSKTTGQVILRNTTVMRRWEADAWEDEAKSIPYGTTPNTGIAAVGMLAEVAWS